MMLKVSVTRVILGRGIDDVLKDFRARIQVGLQRVGKGFQEFVRRYPPPRPLRPGQRAYWKRGLGWVYLNSQGAVVRVDPISEKLGTRWEMTVFPLRVVVSNNASYSGYVHLHRYQLPLHATTGWLTERQGFSHVSQNAQQWFGNLL